MKAYSQEEIYAEFTTHSDFLLEQLIAATKSDEDVNIIAKKVMKERQDGLDRIINTIDLEEE